MGKRSLRSLIWLVAPAPASTSAHHHHRELLGLRGGVRLPKKSATQSFEAPPTTNVTVPIHAMKGSHHADIYISSPPQRQRVILDTGSRIVAFPCKAEKAGNCKSCGKHVYPYFDTQKSITHRFSKCGSCLMDGISTCSLYGDRCSMEQRYTEGSKWSGNEVEDVVWFGSADKVESVEVDMQLAVFHAFGCQFKSEGMFKEQYADGILGLALDDRSIIAATHRARAIARNAFSLCFTPLGGTLSMGGTHPKEHHLETMKMTPITREHGLYSIEMVSLEIGDVVVTSDEVRPNFLRRINNGKNGCLFDSGTTDTFLPAMFIDDMGYIAMNVTGGLMDFSSAMRSRQFTYEEFQRLPTIRFRFTKNAILEMQPQYFMEGTPIDQVTGVPQPWEGSKKLSNRVYVEEQDGAVLGSNAMFGHDILFDAEEHQIGIAKAKCSSIFGK